ncbi:DUF6493 family protein [Dactylosporangium sp. CA-139066]|uniref:DUF6493 family protein n=1 Tax=Dactylosporangium sp. CA-139066 TaxID=3239930 RepID=UPI003D8FC2EA
MNALDLDLVRRGRVAEVSAAVAGLDDAQRAALAAELLAWVRRRSDNSWSGDELTALCVAVAASAPSAAAAARILAAARWVAPTPAMADAMIEAASARGVDWMPDLAHRMAEQLMRRTGQPDPHLWGFVARLLGHAGSPPPTHDAFVRGWLSDLAFPSIPRLRSRPVAERLRDDPFLDTLLPHVFTIDGGGEWLAELEAPGTGGRFAIVLAIAGLAAEGRADRAMLLRGCLSRLLRGDRPASLRGIVALLTELAPTPDEVTAAADDLLRLLADAPPSVATAAQKLLRAAPGVELDAILEASRAVLRRPDKGLVRGQLTWLDALARRHRDRAADIAGVLGEAADHPAIELRDRAAALAVKHGGAVPAVTAAGSVVARDDDLPPPAPAAAAPPPIADPDELAEEVAAFYGDRPFAALLPLERILDAAVRLAAADRPGLRAALMPVLERHRQGMGEHGWDPRCLCGAFTGLLHAAADAEQANARRGGWATVLANARRELVLGEGHPDRRVPPIHRLLRARLAEIGSNAGALLPGGPLSAPTSANGALDVDALLDRVGALGSIKPWPWDLAQALLRIPPDPDEPSAARAEAIGTPTAARVAARLREGGLPAPQWHVELVARRPRERDCDYGYDELPVARLQVTTGPPPAGAETYGLLGARPGPAGESGFGWHELWPGMLPWHRGLAAAFALPDIAAAADMDVRGQAGALPLLAETAGDPGPALPIAVAYALAARHEQDRLAAIDALLLLAAAGSFDAEAAGAHLGTLSAAGAVTVGRAVQPLRDAASAGAPRTVWRLLGAALPALLAAKTPPRGTPDLLTLAAETAVAAPGAARIEGLEAIAAKRGTSRLATEARRLAAALPPPP